MAVRAASVLLVGLSMWTVACGQEPMQDPPKVDKLPTLSQLAPKTWNELQPGGQTKCGRGTPYSFFVYPGPATSNKVVIDFMGGGACWTDRSCSLAGSLFADSIDDLRDQVKMGFPGVYNHDKPGNPFADWHHVVVAYCTGDIHWGDSSQTYGTGDQAFTIEHRGAQNARAVLAWVAENMQAPESVFVTGCSAGSYGSVYWTPHVKKMFPTARVAQLGDSGAGVVTSDFFQNGFPRWNATAHAPDWIPMLNPKQVDYLSLSLPDLYIRLSAYYPELRLAQYNTAADENQTFFYTAMGGNGMEWTRKFFGHLDQIQKASPQFSSFTAPGTQHCILPFDNYATTESNGVKFVDWLKTYMQGGPVDRVECKDCRPMP